MNAEQKRLEEQKKGRQDWRLWGPYLAERAWGTVREDYSPHGTAWHSFDHDQARSRTYRWSEDGMGGICDQKQQLCLALAVWNGRDAILKERAFGLTGHEGNHGEDVKEFYFYLDATPSHSHLHYLYKYPQTAFPYQVLIEENRRRGRDEPAFGLLDSGVFAESRYWDIELTYTKIDAKAIQLRITIHNRGPEMATLHLLPTLWFRNTWSWGDAGERRPVMAAVEAPAGTEWAVQANHPDLGTYHLYGSEPAELLFTENETNTERLWQQTNASPFVKDAFHQHVVDGEGSVINKELKGTKFAAWSIHDVAAGESRSLDYLLTTPRTALPFSELSPFSHFDRHLEKRQREADSFYRDLFPHASDEAFAISRQALAGLIWNKQFYAYEVNRWLEGDRFPPPQERLTGRNNHWRHLKAADVILMPDSWEYPWFAAWDLAFHAIAMTLVDLEFAKDQVELLLSERYLHPNGQIPAYEWAFDDVNPPLVAFAALECYRAEQTRYGHGDLNFLSRIFHKLLLNYGWWLNRKDSDRRSLFEGGFLGLDNISVYDRSQPLPPGYSLKQADATGWMAMFALNLTVIAVELAQKDPGYEDMAIQLHSQFFAIASAIHGFNNTGVALWDDRDQFFKDALMTPFGVFHLPVYSWVGLIPLFCCEIIGEDRLSGLPRYREFLMENAGGMHDGHIVCACPHSVNSHGDHLFTLTHPANLEPILARILDEEQFLSPYGVRSLSKMHRKETIMDNIPEIGEVQIAYEPGESQTELFGGNSNWRGPVWMPLNFMLIKVLDRFRDYLGEDFSVRVPAEKKGPVSLKDAADLVNKRLAGIYLRDDRNIRPVFAADSPFQHDPHWRDLLLFHEYFHGETGQGLGASHQTGWTALIAQLLTRKH